MDTIVIAAILLIAGAAMMVGAQRLRNGRETSPPGETARWLHVAGRGVALGAAVVLAFEAASSIGLT